MYIDHIILNVVVVVIGDVDTVENGSAYDQAEQQTPCAKKKLSHQVLPPEHVGKTLVANTAVIHSRIPAFLHSLFRELIHSFC